MITQSVYLTRSKVTKLYRKWIEKMNKILSNPLEENNATNLLIFLSTNGLLDEKTINDRFESGEIV